MDELNLFPVPPQSLALPESPGLPPLPKPLETRRPIRWAGDDGNNVAVEIQGHVVCVAVRNGPLGYVPPKRQEIGGFSRSSRLRLFKLTNRIDFPSAGRVTFMTQTWRDEVGRPTAKQITNARSAFQKSVERHAGKAMPGIWRVEWKKRLTGRFAGQPMPHVHTLFFRAPYMEKEAITRAWARAINWDGRVSVRLEEVVNLKACLAYVSKYLAKISDCSNLDIVSYLAAPSVGRQWGTYRKNDLPLADKWYFRIPPGKLLEEIRLMALESFPGVCVDPGKGFVVFGEVAKKIADFCEGYLLPAVDEVIS